MSEFPETTIGSLPPGWEIIPFRETCLDFFGGGTPSTKEPQFWDGGIPWTTSAYLEGLYLRSGQRAITETGLRNSASRVVPAGNLLIGTRVGVGKTAVNLIDIAISQDLTGAIVNKERFLPEYLALHLQTSQCQSVFQLQKRGATIKGIPREDLYRIEIAAPPLPEQRAIAGVLARIQAAVEVQEKIVAALKELKAATMARLFREGLRSEPLKQTEIGEIPESWKVVFLGELCADPIGFIQTGPFGSQLHASDYVPDGIPIVNPTHIDENRIRHEGIPRVSKLDADRLQRHRLKVGDILFSRRGDVGRHAHVFEKEEGWLCGTGCLIVRAVTQRIFPLYLSYFLSTPFAQEYLRSHAVGSIMPNINTKVLVAVPVAVPSYDEQQEIAESLRAFDERIQREAKRKDVLSLLFSSMLHLLMTGQVRVTRKMIALQALADRAARRPKWSGKVDEKILEEIVRRIVEAVAPEKIVLFGSAARGEMGPDSDVDLLIVKECENRRETARIIRRKLIGIGIPIDVIVATPDDITRHKDTIGLIYRPALREGKVVYAA